jgi:hypothetical protein
MTANKLRKTLLERKGNGRNHTFRDRHPASRRWQHHGWPLLLRLLCDREELLELTNEIKRLLRDKEQRLKNLQLQPGEPKQ